VATDRGLQEHWAVGVSFNIGMTLVIIVILLIVAAHFGIGPWVNP
jgi:hypothetical protein